MKYYAYIESNIVSVIINCETNHPENQSNVIYISDDPEHNVNVGMTYNDSGVGVGTLISNKWISS